MMKLTITLIALTININTNAVLVSDLIDGTYKSRNKNCSEKELINTRYNGEKFYILGTNTRFVYQPTFTRDEDKINSCITNYETKVLKNKIINKKINKPCKNQKKISRTSTLEILSKKSFKYINKKGVSCLYSWMKK